MRSIPRGQLQTPFSLLFLILFIVRHSAHSICLELQDLSLAPSAGEHQLLHLVCPTIRLVSPLAVVEEPPLELERVISRPVGAAAERLARADIPVPPHEHIRRGVLGRKHVRLVCEVVFCGGVARGTSGLEVIHWSIESAANAPALRGSVAPH